MSQSRLFLSVNQSCDEALRWVDDRLKTAGMLPLHTFDLKVARSFHGECTCPQHGTKDCTCQVVFLLIYRCNHQLASGQGETPVSLMIHGHDSQTWLYIVDSPQQRPDPCLETSIRQTLIPVLHDPSSIGSSPAA